MEGGVLHVREGKLGPPKVSFADDSIRLSTSNVRGLAGKKK